MIKFLCYSVAISAVAAAIELFLCCGQIALNVGLKYSMFLAGNVVCSWSFCCFGVFLFVFFLLCVLLLLCSWKVLRVAFVFCSFCCFFLHRFLSLHFFRRQRSYLSNLKISLMSLILKQQHYHQHSLTHLFIHSIPDRKIELELELAQQSALAELWIRNLFYFD